jgi:polar amino acid transport system substrate-binding protein
VTRWLVVVLVAMGLALSSGARATTLDEVRAAGALRVAVLDGQPPMSFTDPATHQLIGYEIDIAHAIARHIGVRLQLVPTAEGQRISLLRSGGADIILAELSITPGRADVIDFSVPYFRSGLRLLVRASDSNHIEDYGASRIAAERGTTQQELLSSDFHGAEKVLFDDASQAFAAMRQHKVDAVLQDGMVLAALLASAPDRADFKILPDSLTDESFAVGLVKNTHALLDAVNLALLDLEASGDAERIYRKWLGPLGPPFATRAFTISVPCDAMTGWTRVDCPPAPVP